MPGPVLAPEGVDANPTLLTSVVRRSEITNHNVGNPVSRELVVAWSVSRTDKVKDQRRHSSHITSMADEIVGTLTQP